MFSCNLFGVILHIDSTITKLFLHLEHAASLYIASPSWLTNFKMHKLVTNLIGQPCSIPRKINTVMSAWDCDPEIYCDVTSKLRHQTCSNNY